MRCAKCGAEVKPTDRWCPYCSQTCTETQDIQHGQSEYDGYEQTGAGGGYQEYRSAGAGRRIHVKRINFSRMGFWPTLLGMTILIALFIFVLPLALLLFFIFSVYLFFIRRIK